MIAEANGEVGWAFRGVLGISLLGRAYCSSPAKHGSYPHAIGDFSSSAQLVSADSLHHGHGCPTGRTPAHSGQRVVTTFSVDSFVRPKARFAAARAIF